jgi:hypothetical protein
MKNNINIIIIIIIKIGAMCTKHVIRQQSHRVIINIL